MSRPVQLYIKRLHYSRYKIIYKRLISTFRAREFPSGSSLTLLKSMESMVTDLMRFVVRLRVVKTCILCLMPDYVAG